MSGPAGTTKSKASHDLSALVRRILAAQLQRQESDVQSPSWAISVRFYLGGFRLRSRR